VAPTTFLLTTVASVSASFQHDSKTQNRRVPPVFPQERREDWKAEESGDVFLTRRREET
jgi:hypothetical protein